MTKNTSLFLLKPASLAFLAALSCAHAGAQDIQNSVVTVSEMLKIDNAQALEKARTDAIQAGLLQPAMRPGAKVAVPLPRWSVNAIFGQSARMSADIVMDGSTAYSASVGSTIGACRVVAIQDKCVSLVPVGKKVRPGVCPKQVCWTGDELTAALQPAQTVTPSTGDNKAAPPAVPMPPIPIPAGSTGPIATVR